MPLPVNAIYLNLIIPWLILFISTKLSIKHPELFPYILLADVWLLSHPHAVSTFFKRDVFDKISKKNGILILAFLLNILAFIAFKFGSVALFNVYFFAQWFHYMRQNYGISISYYKKLGSLDYLFQKIILHTIPVLALMNLFAKGPLGFFGYYIYFPALPMETGSYIKALFFLFLSVWIALEGFKLKNKQFNLIYFLYSTSNFTLYFWVYFYMSNFLFGWLGLTIYHNIQYLVFSWSHEDYSRSKKRFYGYYLMVAFASFLVFGIIELGEYFVYYYAIPISLVGTLAVNFTHYIYDSVIWKNNLKVASS